MLFNNFQSKTENMKVEVEIRRKKFGTRKTVEYTLTENDFEPGAKKTESAAKTAARIKWLSQYSGMFQSEGYYLGLPKLEKIAGCTTTALVISGEFDG